MRGRTKAPPESRETDRALEVEIAFESAFEAEVEVAIASGIAGAGEVDLAIEAAQLRFQGRGRGGAGR